MKDLQILPIRSGLVGAEYVCPHPPGFVIGLLGYQHRVLLRPLGSVTTVTGFVMALGVLPIPVAHAEFQQESDAWQWAREWVRSMALAFVALN